MKENNIAELERRINELEGKFNSVDNLAREVARCQSFEKTLQLRLEFEEIITQITTEFINLLPSEIDAGINRALAKVGKFSKVDRCYVFNLSDDGELMSNTHEYCAAGVKSRIAELVDLPVSDYPWVIKELGDAETILVNGVDDFPSWAKLERQEFIANGVRAFVIYALRIKDRLIGFVGFDWIKNKCENQEQMVALLNVLSVAIANTLERQKLELNREGLISELRTKQEDLLTLSIRDELTGLYNRRHMEDSLSREISRALRYKTPLAIIMLDLDYFKKINDTFGHQAGDLVLRELGRFLRACSRGEDVVCRYGGEEFVVIMPGASLASGLKRAEDICRDIPANMQIKYREEFLPEITVSLGVASYPEHGETADLLLYNADNALYMAKRAGRNQVMSA